MFIYSLLLGHLYISLVIGGSPIFYISPTIQNEIQFRKLYFTRVSRFRALSLSSLKGKSCTGDFRINPLIWREECSHKYIFRLMRWIEAVTSLLNVEISLKCVTTGHLPSAPLPNIIREALALKNTLLTRADKGWAVKRALHSSFNVWCGVGLARALFPCFRWASRPAKFSFLQTGNPIFFL